MAIKKSELYTSLWKSCDELRGGMDASQYKDYILPLLFLKYASDKYAGKEDALVTIPEGASFADLVKMKGNDDIGDYINKKVMERIDAENHFKVLTSMGDFNDEQKLGKGKEMVDRLSRLIGIFQNPALDFSANRAEDDDLLGDAYEYLMRNFATQSGKSKGQFYTPAEVSRIMAKVIDVDEKAAKSTTVYDPTCGSGSLLLKVVDEAPNGMTIYGQEMDNATTGLAKLNMLIHNQVIAVEDIVQGNTLANPIHLDKKTNQLKRFDYVVANPPFSAKTWSTGVDTESDPFKRFEGFGVPPQKNGDYAFLLHIISVMKSTGKGAIILPHGVLFRGNAEANIRQNIIRRGYIKGIIGLPPNLFYGTGIPACILVLDKENAHTRKGIFFIDAGKGYIKDGNKNRLREQDIHKIVTVFNQQIELPKYARMVSIAEIEQNEYNLNIPRYIDSQEAEDIQDIEAHLLGGIPQRDIDQLDGYWQVYPDLRQQLFKAAPRKGYLQLAIPLTDLKDTIFQHPQFIQYRKKLDAAYEKWEANAKPQLLDIQAGTKPKQLIENLAGRVLDTYADKALIDKYDIYQHLLDYWLDTLKDDCYLILDEGWTANLTPVTDSKGKTKKGEFICELIPAELLINRYFQAEHQALRKLEAQLDECIAQINELIEAQAGEDSLLTAVTNQKGNISKSEITRRLKILMPKKERDLAIAAEPAPTYGEPTEKDLLLQLNLLYEKEAALKKNIKKAQADLQNQTLQKYPTLNTQDIQQLVVHDKWLAHIRARIHAEIDHISQRLTNRIKELAQRYQNPLPKIEQQVQDLQSQVNKHLKKMGY